MLVGTNDHTCPYATAVETASIIGDMVTHFESIEGVDHVWYQTANDDWFIDLVISQLQVPESSTETTFLTE